METDEATRSFTEFFTTTEPLLRRALVSAFGPELAGEAAAEALTIGWTKWALIRGMDNPAGYVYRIAERYAARQRRTNDYPKQPIPEQTSPDSNFEPGLAAGLNGLSTRQRQVVVLIHGFGYSQAETAALLGLGRSTVQSHVERGMAHLRTQLGVDQ